MMAPTANERKPISTSSRHRLDEPASDDREGLRERARDARALPDRGQRQDQAEEQADDGDAGDHHREREDDDEQERAEERDLADQHQQGEHDEDHNLDREESEPEDDQLGNAHQSVDERIDRAARRDAARVVHLQQARGVQPGTDRDDPEDERQQPGEEAERSRHRQQQAGDDDADERAAQHRDDGARVAQSVDGLQQARERVGRKTFARCRARSRSA